MPPEGELGLIILILVLSASFSGSEVAYLSVGRTRARQMQDAGVRVARILCFLQRRRALVLSTVVIGTTASNYMAERLAVSYALGVNPVFGPIVAMLVMLVIVLVFCEVVPIQYAARNPEKTAIRAAILISVAAILLSPIVFLFAGISRLVLRLFGIHAKTVLPSVTEEHLKAMIEQGEQEGAIAATERRMLRGVLEFGDYVVGQIMTPRPDMVSLEDTQSLREALDIGLERGHSRLPAYHETLDDIVGVLHMKDLLPYALEDDLDRPVSELARPVHHVPESCAADELLQQLQANRQMMAIVRDEFGGTAGLVTVEDLLEEIVGDIRDEYDGEEQPEIVVAGPDEYICDARVSLHELQDHLKEELPTDEFESLSGLLLDILGHIPSVGESASYGRLTLAVERMNGKRIELIRVVENTETE